MTTEDNYNKPTRTVQDWISEGYTEAYAKALDAQQKRADARRLKRNLTLINLAKKRNAATFYSLWDEV